MLTMAKVTMIGVIDDDPEIRALDGEDRWIGLFVVTGDRWRQRSVKAGETDDQRHGEQWHRVVIAEPDLVTYAEQTLRRGDQVYIEGGLHTASWRDDLHEVRSLTSIVLWRPDHRLARMDVADRCGPAVSAPSRALAIDEVESNIRLVHSGG